MTLDELDNLMRNPLLHTVRLVLKLVETTLENIDNHGSDATTGEIWELTLKRESFLSQPSGKELTNFSEDL